MSTAASLRAPHGALHRLAQRSNVVMIALAIGIAIRLLSFAFSFNSGGDSMARVDLSAAWLAHPNLNLFAFRPWLPLHFWVIAGSMSLFGPTVLSARLVSLIAGIISLFVFWKIARRLYPEQAAVLSLLIFAFYTVNIGYGSVSSSEALYLCLVLSGIHLFLFANESEGAFRLMLSGLAFTAAAAVRYEAWVLMFAFGLLLSYRAVVASIRGTEFRRRWKTLILFTASAGVWPAVWMIVCWRTTGNLLYFVAMNHEWVPDQIRETPHSMLYRLALPPGVLLISLSGLCIAGVYWLFHWHRDQLDREIIFVFLIFAAVQYAQILSGGVMSFARYTITLGAFLALFSGPGLVRSWTRLRLKPAVLIPLSSAVLIVNIAMISAAAETRLPGSDKLRSIGPRMQYPHRIDDVGKFLRDHLHAGDRVVIDYYNEESGSILIQAGLPEQHGSEIFEAFPSQAQDTAKYIEHRHPKYLVYSRNGTLSQYLALSPGCSKFVVHIAGRLAACAFDDEVYRIYEFSDFP